MLDFEQVDKIFNKDLLDMITSPQGIGKNTDKSWIIDTTKQVNIENISKFFMSAVINGYNVLVIKKPLIKGA